MDNRPIGVFDSGVGGVTVLKELKETLPYEDYIYIGDTASFPYGNKSKETIIELSRKRIEDLIKILPEFKIANATIHFDETSPHLHIVGVPVKERI